MESLNNSEKQDCKSRVRESFKSRFNDIMELWDAYMNGDADLENENIFEYGLSFDYNDELGCFIYLISTGGPHEEFRVFTSPCLKVQRVEFWLKDWFDGAKVNLTGKKLEKFTEFFNIMFIETGTCDQLISESKA